MRHREEFIRLVTRGLSIAEVSRQCGISRKTGHKWWSRFLQGGMPNLVDQSRAAHNRPNAVSDEVVARLVALRQKYPTWGPKKLRAWLVQRFPDTPWPCESTVGQVLKRAGLVQARKPRRRTPYATQPLAAATEPNLVWCADFKGNFRVGGRYCYPLTITDAYSRFLLRCEALDSTELEPTKRGFEEAFKEFGRPLRIRTDNGSPFATASPGGLSRLSIWWVKQGILPERIEPGKPQQNGRHERMHRTLKYEATMPAQPTKEDQQRVFDAFRQEYNYERPHEALEQQTPASRYEPSRWAALEPTDPEYPDHFEVRRAGRKGLAAWKYGYALLGSVFKDEVIGFEPVDDRRYQLWFGPIYLGLLTEGANGKHKFEKNLPEIRSTESSAQV